MKRDFSFALIFFGVFLLLCGPSLVQINQFVDSLTYSAIAKNMALSESSFWTMQYVDSTKYFYDHPPLSMFLQSMLFRISGNSNWIIWPHFLFVIICLGLNLLIIKFYFNSFFHKKQYSYWLILLSWLIIPGVFWAFSNNMLENLLSIFTSLAVLSSLVGFIKNNKWLLLLGSVSISLAFLTKGFVGLFPLSAILIYAFFHGELKKGIRFTVLLLFITCLILISIFKIPEAKMWLANYLDQQVISSINGERINNKLGHLFIPVQILLELLPLIGVVVLAFIFKKVRFKKNKPIFYTFFTIGLSASLPLAISPKSYAFYLIPSLIFFVLATFSIIDFNSRISKKIWQNAILFLGCIVLIFGIWITSVNYRKINRDHDHIEITHQLQDFFESKHVLLDLSYHAEQEYVLRGYLVRYGNIYTSPSATSRFILLKEHELNGNDNILWHYDDLYLIEKEKIIEQ